MRKSILTGIWLLLILAAHAEASFKADVSASEVRVGDIIQVTFAVENGTASRFVPPDFSPFDVVYGPAKSQSFRVINGKVSRSISFTYGIRATKQGKFNIPGAVAEVDGESRKTNSVVITVTPSGFPGSTPQEMPDEVKGSDQIFVLVTADKKEAWQGEQVILTYRLYYRVSFENVQIMKTPSYNGFLMHDFKVGQLPEDIITYNGRRYYTQLFKKVALFPSRAGVVNVSPVELECTVIEEVPDPNFNDPFFSTTRERKVILRSNEVSLRVKPLPAEGKPADFSGAVGQFSLEAGLDRPQVAAGEGATVKAVLHGAGNLKIAQVTKPEVQEGLDIYDPTITDDFSPDRDALRGDRSFDFVIVPAEPGDYTIQPLSFSYFDPYSAKYVTLRSGSFSLKAIPATVNESRNVSRPLGWKKTLKEGLEVAAYAIGLSLLVLSVLGLIFFLFYRRRVRRRIAPVKVERESKENNPLDHGKTGGKETLQALIAAVEMGDAPTFYRNAPQLIWQSALEAGMHETGVYNKTKLLQFLRTRDPALASAAEHITGNSEMFLYGGSVETGAADDLQRLLELLSKLH